MKKLTVILLLGSLSIGACSQNPPAKSNVASPKDQQVGGSCEGCEAVYESAIAFDRLSWTDTMPGFADPGPKIMIMGTVFHSDGKTPAKDVVLYIYQTDQRGEYVNKNNETNWGRRHGYIRGWMKTNEKGQYKFYTLQPASYPNTRAVKHIHPIIKEPGKSPYWIDEFVFEDDPYLTADVRRSHQERGGDGVIKLKEENGLLVGERNIYLGKNIPGYPKDK